MNRAQHATVSPPEACAAHLAKVDIHDVISGIRNLAQRVYVSMLTWSAR
jgi:hypothetical protein